ncbi:MAG: hypothetical protein AB8G18_13905 [Gammaproteobacteria bacterium]
MKADREDLPLPNATRGQVARDLLVFEAKLFLDGLKDVILSPVSLIAGLIGIAFGRDNPGLPLYEVLRFGKRMEGWINMFSAAYPVDKARYTKPGEAEEPIEDDPSEPEGIANSGSGDFDSLVDRLQATLSDAEARSELSEKSKRTLVAITRKLRREQDQGHK